MTNGKKQAAREKRTRAYRDLIKSFARISDVYAPTPASIFDCLSKAHLSESHAISSALSREELFREDSQALVPEELSDGAIAKHFANAGNLYGTAATDCTLTSDLPRAFKYFRKAAMHCRAAARLHSPCDEELLAKAEEYREKMGMVRQVLARKNVLRKKLSLGLLKRRR